MRATESTELGRLAFGLGLIAATLLPAGVAAHPHHHVEQQAQLTISTVSVELVLRIVPSIDDGAGMFDAIDLDADGEVSQAEASGLAAAILQTASLRWGGRPLPFEAPKVALSPRAVLAQGRGVIEVRASAPLAGFSRGPEELDFDIGYDRFSPRWFVQPYASRDLLATSSLTVDRRGGAGVTVRITAR